MASWQDSVRDFFRRIGEYLRRGSEKAGEWIDEQAAITKRVRAIRKLRSQQRQVLEIIGSKVYTLHTRGKVRNKDVLAECKRVDEILAQIERLRREIEEIKEKSRHPQVKLMEVEDEAPIGEEEETGAESGEEQGAENTAEEVGEGQEPQTSDEPEAEVELHDDPQQAQGQSGVE